MKYESGANNIQYDYFSVNGQMARELKRSIKEKKRLELALELLAAVNRDAYDRGKRGDGNGDTIPGTFRGLLEKLPVGHEKEIETTRGRFMRKVIWCPKHQRKEFRLRRI